MSGFPTFRLSLSLTLALSVMLSACNSQPYSKEAITPITNHSNIQSLTTHSNKPFIEHPQPDNYSICLHNTCGEIAFVSLSDMQWQTIKNLFSPKSNSAEQERQQIKLAIALFETYTGQQTGTDKDQAENNLSTGINGQMDCIDEATNSTVYLRLLQNANLLTWHQQSFRTSRGFPTSPHNTATIIEVDSQLRFAVDSWFEANGQPPHIVPLAKWKAGWKPEK